MRTFRSLFVVVIALGAQACGPREEPPAEIRGSSRPVLVIGLDGATWDLIDPWIQRGELPNFERLREQGAWGPLEWPESAQASSDGLGIVSPVIWTTFATGKRPEEHGILGFRKPDGESYTNLDRRARALWNILSDRQRSSDVVGWFTTWPVDVLNGRMISDRSGGAIRGGHYPPTLESMLERTEAGLPMDEVRRQLESFYGPPVDLAGANWEDRSRTGDVEQALEDIYRVDRLRLSWTAELMAERPADLTAVFFKGIDAVSHTAWLYMEPELFADRFRPDEEIRRRFENLIFRYYEFMDEAIGTLLRAAPRDANVVVVSDHGFGPGLGQPGDATYYVNSILSRLGWMEIDDDGFIDPERSVVVDPSEPWEAVRPERVLWVNAVRLFADDIDPGRRETELQALVDRLSSIRTVDGLELFERVEVASSSDCLDAGGSCELVVRMAAELGPLARPDAGITGTYVIDGAEFPLSEVLGVRIGQSGTHRRNGIILMAGPDVRSGVRLDNASAYEVAPTVLRLLGLPSARDMTGRVLKEALKVDGIGFVATYESDDPVSRVEVSPGTDLGEQEERQLDQLRALGYIK